MKAKKLKDKEMKAEIFVVDSYNRQPLEIESRINNSTIVNYVALTV